MNSFSFILGIFIFIATTNAAVIPDPAVSAALATKVVVESLKEAANSVATEDGTSVGGGSIAPAMDPLVVPPATGEVMNNAIDSISGGGSDAVSGQKDEVAKAITTVIEIAKQKMSQSQGLSADATNSVADMVSGATENAKEAIAEVIENTQDTVSDVKEKISETVENAVESAQEVLDHINDATNDVDSVIDSAQETTGDVIENLQDATSDVIENLQDATSTATENSEEAISEAIEDIQDATSDAVDVVGEALGEVIGNVEDAASEITDTIDDFVEDDLENDDDSSSDLSSDADLDSDSTSEADSDDSNDSDGNFFSSDDLDVEDSFLGGGDNLENVLDILESFNEDMSLDTDDDDNDSTDSGSPDDIIVFGTGDDSGELGEMNLDEDNSVFDDEGKSSMSKYLNKVSKVRGYLDAIESTIINADNTGSCPALPVHVASNKVTITTKTGCRIVIKLQGATVDDVLEEQDNMADDGRWVLVDQRLRESTLTENDNLLPCRLSRSIQISYDETR